ncbi:type II toxin-antitoxin system VapC family toxin [Candidatus Peregrinibacteria bacterium]|jgi:PIN domain nuclease of toxin-antitoxin system|nr:type II toxin-antitoxin system VapC family toxin [Candidatus Peregrinibacteria bacterium]MBT4631655.1 type II toxin-antitoxin system VapC family toxin [Candidatus Peregrinibacteria bacterium]MBT5516783.1 type II toxin-antitoxin system VapC family toxin [Candidatus Peregrinibacteria bacterium]MBT5823935.1 type II toxin-antitoxin system VapC family toxin [Candidatus Peregrinibacteria bacterium]
MIILDTHSLIWLMEGDKKIKPYLPKIKNAQKKGGIIISNISIWELAMLESRGRISLNTDIKKWVNTCLNLQGIKLQEITPEIAIDSCNLPDNFHGDPADRIISSSARILNAKLLTFDKEILKYAKKGHLKVVSTD